MHTVLDAGVIDLPAAPQPAVYDKAISLQRRGWQRWNVREGTITSRRYGFVSTSRQTKQKAHGFGMGVRILERCLRERSS